MISILHAHDPVTHILIDHGVDIREHYPSWGQDCTILHMAAFKRSAVIVELLLMKGMNIEAKDDSLQTPLHWAVRGMCSWDRNNSCARMVGVLLRNHANPDTKTREGRTPQ